MGDEEEVVVVGTLEDELLVVVVVGAAEEDVEVVVGVGTDVAPAPHHA